MSVTDKGWPPIANTDIVICLTHSLKYGGSGIDSDFTLDIRKLSNQVYYYLSIIFRKKSLYMRAYS
jgi:hypothetical protein